MQKKSCLISLFIEGTIDANGKEKDCKVENSSGESYNIGDEARVIWE